MTNLTARLAAIRNRIAARLPGVPGVSLEIGPSADEPVAVLVLFGEVVHATVMLDQCETDDEIIAEALDIIADDGFAVLPEIVLTEDSALTLAGHSLRIAETQTGVSASPRVPVDAGHEYTAELAEADVERVARAIADYEPGSPWPDERACIDASRPAAALLLSKLHGWKRGAPPESPGHAHARAVFEAEAVERPATAGWTSAPQEAVSASGGGNASVTGGQRAIVGGAGGGSFSVVAGSTGMPGLRSTGPIMLDGKPHDEYGRELPDEDEP